MKFGRVHHIVDYSGFKDNELIRDEDVRIRKKVNEYGLILQKDEDYDDGEEELIVIED